MLLSAALWGRVSHSGSYTKAYRKVFMNFCILRKFRDVMRRDKIVDAINHVSTIVFVARVNIPGRNFASHDSKIPN